MSDHGRAGVRPYRVKHIAWCSGRVALLRDRVLFLTIFCWSSLAFAQQTEYHWILPREKNPTGVIVALHGLNSAPHILDEFATCLASDRFATIVVTLAGNEPALEKRNSATAQGWIQNLKDGVKIAQEKFPSVQLYNLSYSAGATVSIVASHESFADPFKGYVLLAPAVGLRTYTRLMEFIAERQRDRLWPSLTTSPYGAHDWVSINSYRALFDLVSLAEMQGFSVPMKKTPGLVVLDPGDEFISFTSSKRFLKDQHAPSWRFMRMDGEGDFTLPYHLITARAKLGEEQFSQLCKTIVTVFKRQQDAEQKGPHR